MPTKTKSKGKSPAKVWSDRQLQLWALFERAIAPPEEITLAEWSAKNLRLPEGQDKRRGHVSKDQNVVHWPYMRDIINAIGDRSLTHGFIVVLERRQRVDRIDGRDDTVERVDSAEIAVGNQCVQDGRRIGKARGFDDDALERRYRSRGAPHGKIA